MKLDKYCLKLDRYSTVLVDN